MNQPSTRGHNTLVSKILQVALGLFVTTSDLPTLPDTHEQLTYDCSFDVDCRWASVGNNVDRWRVARGEPDSLLWLAATGTMQIPREPYALIESRGSPVDALVTDAIRCQHGTAELSFIFWVIGNTDLEICLTHVHGDKFNCTGKLNSSVMPGKVSLKIPELQTPFRIMIQPSSEPGVIILDDIRYDASICKSESTSETKSNSNLRGRPDFMTTSPPRKIRPWNSKITAPDTKKVEKIVTTTTEESIPETTTTTTTTTTSTTTTPATTTTTEIPFDLFIVGNKTKPMMDRRTGKVIKDSTQLLCDFNNEFACQWGPEAGRWAIIENGAIPSLENSIADETLLPTYPASLVLQGTAMLSSDPIECQTGSSKVLFRYWSNGEIMLQVCALGHDKDSDMIHCFDQSKTARHEKNTLAVFEMNTDIKETFTLNIVPQWEAGLKNRFLVIDEIAYIGSCSSDNETVTSLVLPEVPEVPEVIEETLTPQGIELTSTTSTSRPTTTEGVTPRTLELSVLGQNKNFKKKVHLTTFSPVFPEEEFTQAPKTRKNWRKTSPPTTTPESYKEDYCDLLNCSFDDTACNYLNHGLTKKPWTLRNRGYGYPLTGTTDIRATQTNGQFVSAILDAGDVAILESPKFNATKSLNVLLFQYFRPSQLTTIRLCLGSRYTNPMRTVSSFVQCPSILRSVTSKSAYRWNTVHIQLPPGTTHFYLVAHSSEKSEGRAAIAIDNMRVAICDTRGFAPDYIDETTDFQSVLIV